MTTISILFRYRDLVADTISEHTKLIARHGSVWWGWWKRPSEDGRDEIWRELETEIGKNGEAVVGLFDSGRDQVRPAVVREIKRPIRGLADFADVPLAVEERPLVPEYYRSSPFSRAWLKMSQISPEPIDFFNSYSLRCPPPMRHFPARELEGLRGKVILDGAELRGMDTTIWQVRKSLSSDSRHRILTMRSRIDEPLTRHPIEARGNTVLHISDPHFGTASRRKEHAWRLPSEGGGSTLADAISMAIPEKTVIGMVVITGDLTSVADPSEFDEATNAINQLLGVLGLERDHLVVVPGNHDIKWTREDCYSDGAPVGNAEGEATSAYRNFYKGLFYHEPNEHLAMGRRFVLPCGLTLEVAGLNSSSLEQGRDFLAGMGRIQELSFQAAARALQWNEGVPTRAIRLLALHHHLVQTDNVDSFSGYRRGFGTAIDAPRIQRLAAKHAVSLVLHGHRHRLFTWRSGVYDLPEQNTARNFLGDLTIIGGGSAGSAETEDLYFNLLRFDPDAVYLKPYRSNRGGAFDPMGEWRALVANEGPTSLGTWEPVGDARNK